MSLALPALEIKALSIDRQNQRISWESNFEKNHVFFADYIALGIAKHAIEELGNTLKDPYKKTICFKRRSISNISLEITKNSAAKAIINFAQDGKELPPFNAWLTKFSGQEKQSDHLYLDDTERNVDHQYFEELMAIVGRLAESKLREVLRNFKSKYADLQFKVEWYRQSDQQISSPSDFRDNCLRIELWFNETIIPKKIEQKSSTSIEQHRVKQNELKRIRTRNNILAVIVVVFIGFMLLKAGVIEISLPQAREHRYTSRE